MRSKHQTEQILSNIQNIEYDTRTKFKKEKILAFLYDNKTQKYKPIEVSKKLHLHTPGTRQKLGSLLQMNLVKVDDERNYMISPLGIEYYLALVKQGKIKDIPTIH